MKKRKLSIFILIILIIFAINTVSLADVGSFDRYDSGDSSWSSSSSDWSSSDWGSSSSSWDYDWDSDSSSGGDGGFLIGLLLGSNAGRVISVIIIICFIIMIIKKKNYGPNGPRNIPYYNYYNQNRTVNTTPVVDVSKSHIYAEQIKQIDPNFSEEKMLSFAKDLFVKLQNAWTARDWEPMRPFESESLFEQHKNQVQGYIDTNRINVMDRIAVNYATLYKFRQEGDRDILEIALKSTMKDYIIDATTKELLEGSKTQDRTTVYKMTFERKTGILTPEGTEQIKTTNCQNCGAPTKITSAGKCEYCGSIITTGANTWVLSGLEPLRN